MVQGLARGRFGLEGSAQWGLLVWAGVSVFLIALLLAQRRNSALAIIAAGTALNVVVVLLNGFMPVFVENRLDVSRIAASPVLGAGFYGLGGAATLAPFLADALRLRAFGHEYLFSAGDILLVVGAVAFIVQSMLSGEDRSSSQFDKNAQTAVR